MKKNKLLIFTGLFSLAIANVFAGNNEKGIEYFDAELYDAAKIFFLQQTNLSVTEQAESYYYLGQVYHRLNKSDSASYYYRKAIEASPDYPFGYVGEGKMMLLQGNKKAAEDLFKKANNYAKKNPAVQTTIAEVYVNIGDYINAIIALDKAKKVNSKYSGIYVVEGDMLMKQGKVGEACNRYDNAILFNKSDKIAYLKSANVYKEINTNIALDYLDRLIKIDPNYIPAYAVIGDIHREEGRYQKALEAYEKFIAIQGVPLKQHERYAQLLYFTDQYEQALDKIKSVMLKDPDNLVMKRLQAYNSLRLENFALGLEQMNRFLEIMPVEDQIYHDYITLGQLALEEKQILLALEAFQKAIDKDPERSVKDNLYKRMASIASNAKLFPESVAYHEKYFEVEPSPESSDFYYYGLACYSAAGFYVDADNMALVKTPEEDAAFEAAFKEYINKGEKAFSELITRRPDSYLGYLWRANNTSLLDKYDGDKGRKVVGYAKPLFEEAIAMMIENNPDGARNKNIIDSYKYIVSYYGAIEDYPNVIEFCKKILQIDPNDEMARKTLTLLKVKF